MSDMVIGFIGLGEMCGQLARRAHAKGFKVGAIYDANANALTRGLAAEIDSTVCDSAAEVCRQCGVIVLNEYNPEPLKGVLSGLMAQRVLGRIFINLQPMEAATSDEIDRMLMKCASSFVCGQFQGMEQPQHMHGQVHVLELIEPLTASLTH